MNTFYRTIIVALLGCSITACGGGGGGDSESDDASATSSNTSTGDDSSTNPGGNTTSPTEDSSESVIPVKGMGVKGPLVDAIVTIYKIDTSKADFKGAVVAEGVTDENAALHLNIATSYLSEPYFIIEYTNGKELGGSTPVLPELRTIVSSEQLVDGVPIYATPLTTLVVDYTTESADKVDDPNITNHLDGLEGNNDGTVTMDEFSSAMDNASRYVKNSFGLDILDDDVDLFTSAPVLTDGTDQQDSLAYRTSMEVFAAVLDNIRQETVNQGEAIDSSALTKVIAKDMTDGTIDKKQGTEALTQLNAITTNTLQQLVGADPTTLNVPGTQRPVAELAAMIGEETVRLASNIVPVQLQRPTL